MELDLWRQPESFLGSGFIEGGAFMVKVRHDLTDHFGVFMSAAAKTRGWQMGNPYLDRNVSCQAGLHVDLRKK